MAKLERVKITSDKKAKMVVDEKNGTIVLGSEVTFLRLQWRRGILKSKSKKNSRCLSRFLSAKGKLLLFPGQKLR